MANKEISELAAGAAMDGTELVHGVQGGNSRKFSADQLRGMAAGGVAALAQGDLLYVGASGVITRLPKGTAGQVLAQNSGLTAPEWATPTFSKFYESADTTMALGGALTFTHGLGARPKGHQYVMVCVNAVLGYIVGEELDGPINGWASQSTGVQAAMNATTIDVRLGTGSLAVFHKTTGSVSTASVSDFKLKMRAWL